jgi:hypothetical protein
MYLGDGLAGSCKIQRWLESYSCEAGASRRRMLACWTAFRNLQFGDDLGLR